MRKSLSWKKRNLNNKKISQNGKRALKLLDGGGEFLHGVVINIWDVVEPGGVVLGSHGQELPTELSVDGDGVVVVVIPDFGLCLVQRSPYHIL